MGKMGWRSPLLVLVSGVLAVTAVPPSVECLVQVVPLRPHAAAVVLAEAVAAAVQASVVVPLVLAAVAVVLPLCVTPRQMGCLLRSAQLGESAIATEIHKSLLTARAPS